MLDCNGSVLTGLLIMTEMNEAGSHDPMDAQARSVEVARLFKNILTTLQQMIATIGPADVDTPDAVIAKLNELKSAHLRILAAEEAFDGPCEKSDRYEDVDFDALRLEIGGQLDRLRAAILADKIPFGIDPCPACRAALSI